MKKQLIFLVLILLPLVASADPVEINGIYYNLINEGNVAEVTSNPNYVYPEYDNSPGYYTGSVVIPESVTYEGVTYSVTRIGNSAFRGCSGITSVTIPNSMKYIGDYAFMGCSSLTSVTCMAEYSPSIGWTTFDDFTTQNATLYIPAYSLSIYKHDGPNLGYNEPTLWQNFKNLAVVNVVQIDGINYSLDTQTKTAVVTYNHSDTYMGDIVIPESVVYNDVTYSVTLIGDYAFYCCNGITSVTIPNSVTDICDFAFCGCSGITSVTIPNSVKMIHEVAFNGCSGLTSVTIGNSVTSISNYAFYGCSGLTSVTCLAQSVPYAEYSYINLENVILYVPTSSISNYMGAYPWNNSMSIVSVENAPKCTTPTISYVDGKLKFSCETEGVEYVSEVMVEDAKKYYNDEVNLTTTYKVNVYATKTGYINSDVATKEINVRGLKGDVDGDGSVSIVDVTTVVDILKNSE